MSYARSTGAEPAVTWPASPQAAPPQPAPPQAAPPRLDYGGRRFRPADSEPGRCDAEPTTGHYHQEGDLVWAEFSGARIRAGWLVGTCRPDDVIDAAYCLVTSTGETIAGACVSTPTMLADGRVRLTEDWRRLDGSAGISHIEELAE